MLARLIAWLQGDPERHALDARCEAFLASRRGHRLDHIRRALEAQGYQPRDVGPQAPPPRGGSSANPPPFVRNVRTSVQPPDRMPQALIVISMPAGAKVFKV